MNYSTSIELDLEVESPRELQDARGTGRRGAKGGDIAEGASTNGYVRVGENRVIQHVERLETNLKSGLPPHGEGAEDAGVDVCLSRPGELITHCVAERWRNNLRGRLEFIVGGLRRVDE